MSTPEELMREIRGLLQDGRYTDAAAACREALGEAPENPDLRMLMGLCDEAAGQVDSARAWMEKALEKDPDHPAAGYHLGRLRLAEGRDEDARGVLEECIARDPNHAAARTLLARIEQRAGRLDAAVEALRTALRADADYAPAHAGLAALLLRRGALDEAHQHASKAISLRPADAFSQVTMAQVFQAQGHHDFAEQCLRNALKQQPGHPQLQAALEQLQRVHPPGTETAATPAALLDRMRSHYRQGQLRAAAEIALALQHRFAAADEQRLEVAEVLMDAGQLEASADVLSGADPGLPRHALTQARLAAVRGQVDSALEQLSTLFAAEQPGLRHDARRLAADLHLRERRLGSALEVLRALRDEPEQPPSTLRMLAQLEHAAGETAAARGLLETLVERPGLGDGERAVSHNLLGRILDESGAYEAAARHLRQGEWRAPFLVNELEQVSPADLHTAWAALESWEHGDSPVDDGRPVPVFVAGWPGSGREAVLPVLAGSSRLALLAPEEIGERRERLRLPLSPSGLAALSDSELRTTRKRYLRGLSDPARIPLEPGLPEVTALPAIARFFPGARLVWMQASEPALRLHWRLAGCREVERMAAVWRAEQELFEHLVSLLPLRVIRLPADRLVDDPAGLAPILAEALELAAPDELGQALARSLEQAGYRSGEHWRHYEAIL